MKSKKILAILVLMLSIVLGNISFAKDNIKDWKYSKDIEINGNNKYKSVFLDSDVYKYSKDNLSDIRIVDNNGDFVPYYIGDGTSNIYKDFIEQRFDRTNKYKKNNDTFIDFKEATHKSGMDNLTNQLKLSIDKNEYLLDIVIYGSFDGVNWEYIKNDNAYRVSNFSKTTVLFDDVKRYTNYRVKILNNIENIGIQYLIGEYDYNKIVRKKYERIVDIDYQIKSDDKVTYITINNDNNLKINDIDLDIDGIFKRHYVIEVNKNNQFISAGYNGDIYNLKFKHLNVENTNINFNNSINDNFRIKIYNNDDKPLKINGLKAKYFVDKVVFESKPDKQYKIYFGNNQARSPKYDIEEYKTHIEAEAQDECSFGQLQTYNNEKVNQEHAKQGFDYKIIFNIVMIIVSIMLIVLIGLKFKAKSE